MSYRNLRLKNLKILGTFVYEIFVIIALKNEMCKCTLKVYWDTIFLIWTFSLV